MIVILDYGMGNVGSIQNILYKIGENNVVVSHELATIQHADKMILPGVGSFDAGMHNLQKYNLVNIIQDFARIEKKPVLGICLGMQLMGRSSEEGTESGLNLIPFDNIKFRLNAEYKIPHMGWNYVNIKNYECPLVRNLDNNQRYYFVHSYHAKCDCEKNVLMTCDYGYKFVAAVVHDNILGVQFHPEKSHQFGIKLFENFVKEY